MLNKKRILIAPLNWGLGHASRCIPIIRELLEKENEVILAAEGSPLKLLQEEFPNLQAIELKGPEIRYPKKLPIPIYFALKMPQLLLALKAEQKALEAIIEQEKIEVVISDNRYGLHHEKVHSILITHQLFVKSPIFERHVQQFIHSQIQQFDECWIPDFEGEENLSGELSHGQSKLTNLKFIGALSRFKKGEVAVKGHARNLMVVLSGPEPHRSNFEAKIVQQLKQIDVTALVVKGVIKEDVQTEKINDQLSLVSHLPSATMREEMLKSAIIICRSGYSSLMDLHALDKKALIVPTKGQTEQEYLANYWGEKENFYAVKEEEMNLGEDLSYFGL